jgi:hypothetical protein
MHDDSSKTSGGRTHATARNKKKEHHEDAPEGEGEDALIDSAQLSLARRVMSRKPAGCAVRLEQTASLPCAVRHTLRVF